MRLGLAQLNPTVGDLAGNADKILQSAQVALEKKVDTLVFSELVLCGYPPEDLLLRPSFLRDCRAVLDKVASSCRSLTLIVGFPEYQDNLCYNAAAICRNGRLEAVYRKGLLPNYGVFDEKRYFTAGTSPLVIQCGQIRLALTICEDIWDLDWLGRFLRPCAGQFEMLVNLSASPFHMGKIAVRKKILTSAARFFNCPVAFCNQVGGQDELVFSGRSMLVDADGQIIAQAKEFEEDLLIADIRYAGGRCVVEFPFGNPAVPDYDPLEEVYRALLLGLRDYVQKNRFEKVVVGLSGGIDSALTAALAVAALGADKVIGITMPSKFNSSDTQNDAKTVAKNLGIAFHSLPIEKVLSAFHKTLSAIDGWNDTGLAYENLQARIRGTLLMSLSNHFGWLVLTTGNKSEIAVGYCTLYGDTAGGFAVIKDVPKTLVYQLSHWINQKAGKPIIPLSTIERAPSAELRPNQKDTDSLPPYEQLDAILKLYIEEDKSPLEIVQSGFDKALVDKVIRMIDRSEYKRRQSPPGIKITPKAFGKDRRMPITNRYMP